MGYKEDIEYGLLCELRKFNESLKDLQNLNKNMDSINRLAAAIEKQNALKEQELGINSDSAFIRPKHL